MTWRDIEVVAELEQHLFGAEAWSAATWWSELRHRPRREYVIAEDTAQVRGYAGLNHGGEVADVMTIAVAESAQGQGVGRMLMEWLLRQAAQRGAGALLLEVRADNVAARTLYERHGFEQIQVRPQYYQPDGVDALILRRHLP